jgi:hypothetical protein
VVKDIRPTLPKRCQFVNGLLALSGDQNGSFSVENLLPIEVEISGEMQPPAIFSLKISGKMTPTALLSSKASHLVTCSNPGILSYNS